MKKFFALVMTLCLLCTVALAEQATANEINWADVQPVVEASGLTGEFVTFENVGVKIWIPEGMTAVEADQLPENNIGYFQAEDGSAVSVAYVDMGGMELSEYANQVAALGIEGIETGKLNGLDCVTYENANEDGSVNFVASFATQMGYILEVAVGPVATDDAKTGASIILASVQAAE